MSEPPLSNPHPSPSEEFEELPLPIIAPPPPPPAANPGDRHSLEREATADPRQYDAGLPQASPPAAHPVRSPRVRFQSLRRSISGRFHHGSHDDTHAASGQPDASQRPLLPPPDLNEVQLPGTVTPPAPAYPRSALARGSTPEEWNAEDAEKREENTVDRTASIRDRFHAAGQLFRQKTHRLGERLGRPADEGEALNASLLPDDIEGGVPLEELQARQARRDADRLRALEENGEPLVEAPPSAEAHRLVRSMTRVQENLQKRKPRGAYQRSGQTTPEGTLRDFASRRRSSGLAGGSGILSQLLKLHASQTGSSSRPESVITDESDSDTQVSSGTTTPKKGSLSPSMPPTMPPSMPTSGTATPRKEKIKWYKKSAHRSTSSLIDASMNLSRASLPASAADAFQPGKRHKKNKRSTRLEDEIRVTVHIAEIISRQRYIMQLCRALMRYGAPTHRLEEYMQMTARVLQVSGQFLYLPGCMIMSFDDPTTRTAEVKLVRMVQGVDLGRLADTHNVYKNVVHDLIGVEEAIQELDEIMQRKPRFNKWFLVLMYGMASIAVGPFAFEARPIDMPIIFFLGCLVGFMQHVLAPTSVLYSNVFEVTAAVLTSFLARAFGSIRVNGQEIFCFSAMAQSSIALILPGFMVLCSSLELQSHQIIAGSIRMVYAIIYSLFLGYGITVGTTVYGLIDANATSSPQCSNLSVWGSEYVREFPFVAIFAVFLAIVNQGKWKQMPVMVFIAVTGYVTNYFSTTRLGSQSEVANTVGAFTIGVLGNLYSRLWHGHAATAILPGIFVLVPSGLASSGSVLAGLRYADQVRQNLQMSGNSTATSGLSEVSVASLGFGMIQVAIGITIGLFIAALVVYPYGKKRTGLFSF